MNPVIWKIVDVGLTLAQAYFTREDVIAFIKKQEDAGATPEQVLKALHDLRDEAAKAARATLASKLAA